MYSQELFIDWFTNIQILSMSSKQGLLTTWKIARGLPNIATTNVYMQTGFHVLKCF